MRSENKKRRLGVKPAGHLPRQLVCLSGEAKATSLLSGARPASAPLLR